LGGKCGSAIIFAPEAEEAEGIGILATPSLRPFSSIAESILTIHTPSRTYNSVWSALIRSEGQALGKEV
jgi:hypothetical protein